LKNVAIVILNWNGRKFLEKFLPGVIEHSRNDARIIVADNASQDDSITFLKSHFPEVTIIENDRNYGFADGYNKALEKVNAEYYILLNSDIEVSENWINPVIELMDKDPMIGACQPKIRSYNEPEKFEYAGAAGGFIDKYGYPFCRGRLFQSIEKDKGQYENAIEVFWATGACTFVRATTFHEFGGFDGDFFAHMEEIDFCWRIKNEGYKVMYCPHSTVYHIGGGTLPKGSARKTYLNFRNNMTLLYKNLTKDRLLKVLIARIFLDGVASVKFLLEGHIPDCFAVIRANVSFYRTFSKTLAKRKKIHQRKVSNIYQGNIALDYFLRQRKKFSELPPKKF
jgi:GT2 family glycosyltransferase